MSTTWIRDKVVAVAEAQAEETGEDPNEIIWQLSKELGHMAQISGSTPPSGETLMDRIRATYDTLPVVGKLISDEELKRRADSVKGMAARRERERDEMVARREREREKERDETTVPALDDSYGLPLIPDVNPDAIPAFNVISRPSHYAEGRKYEPKDVIRDWGLNFNVGSAVKYCSRHGKKDDAIQDLEKAREFIGFEIDALKAERDEQEEA